MYFCVFYVCVCYTASNQEKLHTKSYTVTETDTHTDRHTEKKVTQRPYCQYKKGQEV